jgi:hypothetical protein
MNRRNFLDRISKALAGAVLGANMVLGELVPVAAEEFRITNYKSEWIFLGEGEGGAKLYMMNVSFELQK